MFRGRWDNPVCVSWARMRKVWDVTWGDLPLCEEYVHVGVCGSVCLKTVGVDEE